VMGHGGVVLVECSSGNVVHHGSGCSPRLVVGSFSDLFEVQQGILNSSTVMFY
jgi:hypothetical protein